MQTLVGGGGGARNKISLYASFTCVVSPSGNDDVCKFLGLHDRDSKIMEKDKNYIHERLENNVAVKFILK